MAKNNTQKTIKALMYLACKKNYGVTITNTSYRTLFSSLDPVVIWKNYKKYSSGIIWITRDDDYESATFTFNISKDEFDDYLSLRTNSKFKDELLTEVEFFMNIYF